MDVYGPLCVSVTLVLGDIEKVKNDYHAENNHDYHNYHTSASNVDIAMRIINAMP